MMTLPPEMDRCLHRHTRYMLDNMVPDGVYVYLSGAKVLDKDDQEQFCWAHDAYGKNHALLNIVAKHGAKGFEAFLEALATTRQTEIVDRLRATLEETSQNGAGATTNAEGIRKIKNDGEIQITSVKQDGAGPSTSSASTSTTVYIVEPARASASSPSRSARVSGRRSLTRATPLTPPLSEAELDNHLARLKNLLRTISTAHGDRYCRHEAKALLGELDEAGEAMMDRLKHLSEENVEKEQELRRAKYMVRGMETEIDRLRTSTSVNPSARTPRVGESFSSSPSSSPFSSGGAEKKNGPKANSKSKFCVIL